MWESICIDLNIQSICQCNYNEINITLHGLPEEYNMIATKLIYFFLTMVFCLKDCYIVKLYFEPYKSFVI